MFIISLCVSPSLYICLLVPVVLPHRCWSIYPLPPCILSGLLCPNWKAELIILQPVLGTSSRPPWREAVRFDSYLKRNTGVTNENAGALWPESGPGLIDWLIWIGGDWGNQDHPSSFPSVSVHLDSVELIGKGRALCCRFSFRFPQGFSEKASFLFARC